MNDKTPQTTKAWLRSLPEIVQSFKDCDIIIYQAGADPHVEDPFGGALTKGQLRQRDKIVFQNIRQMNIPVVWDLAGGYSDPFETVLQIHDATMEECLSVIRGD